MRDDQQRNCRVLIAECDLAENTQDDSERYNWPVVKFSKESA